MTNTNDTNAKSLRGPTTVLVGVLAAGALAGCGSKKLAHGERFEPEDQPRQTPRFAEVQKAVGARTDATLRPYHFDEHRLNSLGEAKLDLMLKDDDACSPLVVYLEMPSDVHETHVMRCEDSATLYLRDHGLKDEQIKVVAGPNLNYSRPAAPALRALEKAADAAGESPEAAPAPEMGPAAADR